MPTRFAVELDKLKPVASAVRVALVSIGVKNADDTGPVVSPSPFIATTATV
jgi:hypothetical protein